VTDERLYLDTIAECIEQIETYTEAGRDTFLRSSLIQDAVIRNFEIIGEAAKQISRRLKDQYPDIPWRRIAGFRDVLIHDYRKVVMEEVWLVVEHDIPVLKKQISAILKSLDD
jgi:uncharacterized protein with HEPN domain